MMRGRSIISILVLISLAATVWAGVRNRDRTVVPDNLGVMVHFYDPPPKDLSMIYDAGFRWVRVDLKWIHVEQVKGVYDFTWFDAAVDDYEARGMGVLFILDYNHPLYGENLVSIKTEEGRRGFANYAAAAAERYAGRNVMFEIWNEPNNSTFWQPEPNVVEYMMLVMETSEAMRAADPDVTLMAPASALDFTFIFDCIDAGVLDYVDALSLHTYILKPEFWIPYYELTRTYLAFYDPEHADIPFVSTEWGYSTAVGQISEEEQAKFLSRGTLIHLSQGTLSFWYDFQDWNEDPYDRHTNMGIVRYDDTPKPSYEAMRELAAALDGLSFQERLPSFSYDHLYLFSDGTRRVVAAWTIVEPHDVELTRTVTVTLTDTPVYITLPPGSHLRPLNRP